jgi:hypothetical protein
VLVLIGVGFALLLLLNNAIKTILKRERVGFIDMLLVFLTVLTLVLALVAEPAQSANAQTAQVVLYTGIGIALAGLVMFVLERVHGMRRFGTRGVLGVGAGALLALATFSVPLTSEALAFPTPTPIQVAQIAQPTSAQTQQIQSATPRRTSSAAAATTQPTLTTTATPTERPTQPATSTPTRWVYSSATPLPTATLPTPCLATTDYNLRLRAEPDREAETLVVIPFSTTITIYGRNEGSTWWFAQYEDQAGWVDGEFITRSVSCDELPVQE